VEAEVARRLEEREQERQREEEQRARAQAEADARAKETSLQLGPENVPSGVLAPLLKQHEDLDNELRRRLKSLGRKL
jgi:kinesin family member 22